MLIGFSVGNYRSFKDVVTFSMVASPITGEEQQLDENNTFQVNDQLSLLKSGAIYGANASGKSNLVAAINFMTRFVLNSSRETQISDFIPIDPFRLSTETENEPCFFEIVFQLGSKSSQKIYRYGFEVNKKRVISEWLFSRKKTRESKIFERNFDNFVLAKSFEEGKGITDKTRNNALFLSVVAQFNGKTALDILMWFRNLNVISGLNDLIYRNYTVSSFESNQHKKDILQLVKKLDLGIEDIRIEKTPLTEELLPSFFSEEVKKRLLGASGNQLEVKTVHQKYDSEGKPIALEVFDIEDNESEGTQKLFSLAGPLLETLKNGAIFVIDELDARFHPLITSAIIKLFNCLETNPKNAQLVFTTHDTNLLRRNIFDISVLRRDQIWFTEKDNQGATTLYSLVEYKVGKNAAFEKDYLIGKYGAIPFIGNIEELIGAISNG